MVKKGVKIEEPSGKLGVLIPGLGAVSTTFIAGVEAIKKKIAQPVGSLTQLGNHPPWKTHGTPGSENSGFRSSRRS